MNIIAITFNQGILYTYSLPRIHFIISLENRMILKDNFSTIWLQSIWCKKKITVLKVFHYIWKKVKVLVALWHPTLWIPWTAAHQVPLSMEFSGKNPRVGCHSLLQGIFPTQGSNPGLLHHRQFLYHLSHQACMRSPLSPVWLCATLWTIAQQAPLSMGFSRQEYWSGLPRPPPGIFPR